LINLLRDAINDPINITEKYLCVREKYRIKDNAIIMILIAVYRDAKYLEEKFLSRLRRVQKKRKIISTSDMIVEFVNFYDREERSRTGGFGDSGFESNCTITRATPTFALQ